MVHDFANRLRRQSWGYAFAAPAAILLAMFTLYPIVASVQYTLYDWNGIGRPSKFVGLSNYIEIARDPFFWNAFRNTIFYVAVLVPTQLSLALVLAVVLSSGNIFGAHFFRLVFFTPVVTSQAVVGVVISILVVSGGTILNKLLIGLGLLERPVDLLGNSTTALWLIIAVGIWLGLGYPLIYFLAALKTVDPNLYDSARVDGASQAALFWHITVPIIRPIVLVVLLITTLYSLRVFDIVQVMTRGGPYYATDVVSTYIYRHAFPNPGAEDSDAQIGYASAAAFLMSLITVGISVVQLVVVRRIRRERRSDS